MAEVKITDLVDQSTIDKIKELNTEMQNLLGTYTGVAKDLAKGLEVQVKVVGDIDKLDKLRSEKAQEAVEVQQKLNNVMQEQAQVVANTSNTISRQLMEQEKANKAQREAYDSHDKVNSILSKVHGAYEDQVQSLIKLNAALAENKRAQNENERALTNGMVTVEQFTKRQVELVTEQRNLAQEKKKLNQVMTAEEKAAQSATTSYSRMSQELELMKKAYKEMSAEERNSAKGKEMEKHIQNLDAHLKDLGADMGEFQRNVGNYAIASDTLAGKLFNLVGVNEKFGKSIMGLQGGGNVFNQLGTSVKAFGQTLMGLLANPYVLALLGIAGTFAAVKWWYDYNKGLIEASRLTENFTGLTGEAADKVTSDVQAMADHMGKDYKETIEAVNVLVQQFGVSWEEAMQLMQDGIVAGADMSGNFVNNIKQFSPAMRDAGVDAKQLIAVLANTRNGIFDEKGVQDIIKGGTRLRAMTGSLASSLDAVGISSAQMQKDLNDGTITMLEAVQQVASKLKELPENSQEAGQIMKDVFGRSAAEGGQLVIQAIADINTNLDECKENMGELGKLNEEQMEAEKELSETMNAVFKMSGTSFEQMTIQAKTYLTKGLTSVIKGCVGIYNWFVRLYNKSLIVRAGVQSIANTFKTMWAVAKGILSQVVDAFKALGTVIDGVLSFEPETVMRGWREGMAALKSNLVNTGREIAQSTASAITNTLSSELKEVDFDFGDLGDGGGYGTGLGLGGGGNGGGGGGNGGGHGSGKGSGKGSGNSAEDRKKALQDELKIIMELEESKIALMTNAHEKELATIRLNFKKKIDAIKGNGTKEVQLRLNIAEQCERAVAECEYKYQVELAKTNLANRLATVEKGSKEELNLKLAQIEAQRKAELEDAEKKGADKVLIEKKFDQQRQQTEEEFAAKRTAMIENAYSVNSDILNNEHLRAVNSLKQRYAEELKTTKDTTALKAQYDAELEKLEKEYAQKTLENTIEMLEKTLEEDKLSAVDRAKYEKQLAEAKISLETQMADAAVEGSERAAEADKKTAEERKQNVEQWMSTAAEAIGKVQGLVDQLYSNQISEIETQMEANTAANDKEQENISALVEKKVITEEEGEARKRAAAAKTAKKNEELEKKKKELQIKQAKWEKANNLAQAGIATALAITKALPNVVLAAIAGAMGAIQIATIAATPIPQYRKGTDYHEGGPAIVGDGGRAEVVMFGGQAWLTPDKPTLVDLPKGASVIPSVEQIVLPNAGIPMLPQSAVVQPKSYNDVAMRREVSELASLIRKHTARQHADAMYRNYELFKNQI